MIKTRKIDYPKFIVYTLVLILFAFSIQNSFFWDTIQLGSKHANFYFSSGFSKLLLPNNIDSGHIPAFGMYLAVFWTVLGKTLWVSHLAMLPFIIGIVWQLQLIIKRFIPEKYTGLALLLLIVDPTLLAQMSLVSPDVALVFFFLFGLNGVLGNQRRILSITILFLFLVSMRGMMVSFCLLVIDLIFNVRFKKDIKQTTVELLKRSLIYLPALVLFIAYYGYHYAQTGWIAFHTDSPWAESFEKVGLKGFIYNVGILVWRLIDFGRIGIYLVFLLLIFKYKAQIFKQKSIIRLLVILLVLLFLLPLNMLWAKGLLAHRYLLPIYLSFSLLCLVLLFNIETRKKLKTVLVAIWLIVLISGNLWIYPDKVSQGWDSTLAHLPYYSLRHQTINYLEDQQIEFEEVQSFFPNIAKIDDIDLNGDQRQFSSFDGTGKYVFYSNVFNISNKEYESIQTNYQEIKEFSNCRIYIKLFKSK